MRTVFEGVTIDPVGAKDLDDAIWASRDGHGWTVQVAFPRLTQKIKAGDRIDFLAQERLISVYRANGFTIPMIPMEITKNASLTRGMQKDAFLVTIRLGRTFLVESVACEMASFKNIGQLTYDVASNLVRTGDGPIGEMLGQARDLAYGLYETRRASGAIAYYDFERGVAFDEEGSAILLSGEGHVAEMIVAEFMILVNACLADWAANQGIPILYRNHERLGAMTREQVLASLEGIPTNADVNLRGFPKLMARAKVGVEPVGHFGLNLPAYAWFTSPLRRYVDLVNQRMIEAHLAGETPPHTIEALDAFAQAVNTKQEEDATQKAEYLKTKAVQKAETLISEGKVGRASGQDFGRVVKVVMEKPDAMTKEVEAESLRRIAAGTVSAKEMTRLLLMGGRVGEAVIARLVANPHESMSLLLYGAQALDWSTQRFEDTQGGPAHARVFVATGMVRVGDVEHSSPPVVRSTKKAAQQVAAVHLLASIAGVAMPAGEEAPEPAAMEESKPKPAPRGGPENNPRNRLQELCAKRKAPLPTFTVEERGSPNNRTFEAVVTVMIDGTKRSSRPARDRTRKGAEKAAAAEMLATLATNRFRG